MVWSGEGEVLLGVVFYVWSDGNEPFEIDWSGNSSHDWTWDVDEIEQDETAVFRPGADRSFDRFGYRASNGAADSDMCRMYTVSFPHGSRWRCCPSRQRWRCGDEWALPRG
jgi:hypothetical protein